MFTSGNKVASGLDPNEAGKENQIFKENIDINCNIEIKFNVIVLNNDFP